jgi:hypothetical protein
MKVRVGKLYRYDPALIDIIDGRTSLRKGDVIRVKNLPGCPPANTMNHCYVVDPDTDAFIGMVCCGSLEAL